MHVRRIVVTAVVWMLGGVPGVASAQTPSPTPSGPFRVEGGVGHTGFIDESLVDHLTIHGGFHARVSRRISLGPEIVYMRGPEHDRDLAIQGTAWFDLRTDGPARRVVPYLVVSGGLTRQSDRYASGPYLSYEGAFSGGGGARINLSRRIYLAPEARLGWEPFTRISLSVGFRR